jgi:hypothetical protein
VGIAANGALEDKWLLNKASGISFRQVANPLVITIDYPQSEHDLPCKPYTTIEPINDIENPFNIINLTLALQAV